MTINFGYGVNSAGVPCLRSAYDYATDLVYESAANIGKFKLDTAAGTKLSYVYDIYQQGYDSRYNNGGTTRYYSFANGDLDTVVSTSQSAFGTSAATIQWSNNAQGRQTLFMFPDWWPWGYLPIVEYRDRTGAAAGVFAGPSVSYFTNSGLVGYVLSTVAYTCQTTMISTGATPAQREAYNLPLQSSTNASISRFTWQLSVLQLPARNDALPDYSATPASGQEQMRIDQNTARLALAGRDVSDANPEHFVFHENKIPAKIMAAGDINVAGSGTVDIHCALPITQFTYMDFHVKKQTDAEFWHPPFYNGISSAGNYGFSYFVDVANQKITITNGTSTAITVRYIIFADSEDAYTTGGKKVFYNDNDGTQDFVQIKRPGSSDLAPNLNDIIADSRLAYLSIVAEGFLNWSTDFPTVITGSERYKGERMATVSIANPSPKFKLFCKTIVVFPSPTSPNGLMAGLHRVFTDAGAWIGRASCDSCWANIHATEDAVDFYMSGDNPVAIQWNGSSYDVSYAQRWAGGSSFPATPPLGLRYYVFAMPQNL
ncbi:MULTISPECIES: hypothetical protein [unclassified Mesorhizobium]|uniref:hypothetical protein n=1 Tax=unclassified Mesorhizobium TaxID=325217 RepID=UPI0010936DEC|nr:MULTISPECIES: hypothetical protein [unclassified Mesorhizobium]TGT90917.1 hypothetical protein EN804_06165 [Mesorhizobium sp. M8A.F.Ca.ET.161.01.1.1]TGV43803.1 hypothetical protein EN785_07380 [Mesorhizobium sp. M8A.F.Ca.ET.142.01.1.1]